MLKFPVDLSDKYYLSMNFYEYSRPSPFSFNVTLRPLGDAVGAIVLPLPSNLEDSLSLNWVAEQSSPIADLAATALPDVGGRRQNAESDPKGAASSMLTDATKGLLSGRMFRGRVNGSTAVDMGLQLYGLAQNPALTVMFKHPEFKIHNFVWKLSPNNRDETTILTNIINTLRYNAAPGVVGYGAFFSYPSIVRVTLHNNTHLYDFQEAVITNMSVNYTPTGVPSMFAGTAGPSEVLLSLQIKEIVLTTRDNIRSASDNGTGKPNNLISSNSSKLSNMNSKK